MTFTLPPLPYALDALAPHLSAETLEIHHGKHHAAYVNKLTELLAGRAEASQTLEQILLGSEGPVFNNAAQIWNHTFYWHSMKPGGGGAPQGALARAIERELGGLERFKADFVATAVAQFGSGWAWLVQNADGSLAITKTGNADLPLKHGQTALLTCDVWEHAYYIDYRNLRPKYVETFLSHLVDWDAAGERYVAVS